MRLLNTFTLELHEFFDEETPLYAILSHTWGNDEVSLRDLERRETEKAGYSKIKSCCELAASEGWQFVWIDTCCIDKSSSAELSEAINSMFGWYQRAQVCYAYLSDVEIKEKSGSSANIRGSRWFTRGWTLQELLAPASLVFYDKNWIDIGTKRSLQEEISSETGIKINHLFNHMDACIAVKLSWASRRRTARREDIAYCLLGLFDLNMPLLYGEGEKAFFRLQYELLQNGGDDESIFAWESREDPLLRRFSGLLAPSPALFAFSGDIEKLEIPSGYRLASNLTRKSMLAVVSVPKGSFPPHKLPHVILHCRRLGEDKTCLGIAVTTLGQRYFHRARSYLTTCQASPNLVVSNDFREELRSEEILLSYSNTFSPMTREMVVPIHIKSPALGIDPDIARGWPKHQDFEMEDHLNHGYLTFRHGRHLQNIAIAMLFVSSDVEFFLIVILKNPYRFTTYVNVVISNSIPVAEALQEFKRIYTDNSQDTFFGTLQRGSQLTIRSRKQFIENHICNVIHVDVIGNHSIFELKDWKCEKWFDRR